jgi:hypothetical protein
VHRHSLPTSYLQGCDPEYVVSLNRYNIFEDYGPAFVSELTPPTFFLFITWPVAIGFVSLFYCGEYSGFPLSFGALAYLFQSEQLTHSTSANVSSAS